MLICRLFVFIVTKFSKEIKGIYLIVLEYNINLEMGRKNR